MTKLDIDTADFQHLIACRKAAKEAGDAYHKAVEALARCGESSRAAWIQECKRAFAVKQKALAAEREEFHRVFDELPQGLPKD
ncbi:hypothetical protein SAMN04488540_102340 [Ferrimonas sediminum]|uniref:Uncharacterized protein n=1 Tax=Ferrimonas sediminum TaxID=718193 RepID=A0A1G8MCJ3_9GAMM|nr:hypothetical protein [Ferrimonas sediminum]SDI65663.1 hypothetical protein SAMN04488540_102340 [Ferrimonas sediminum]